MVGVPGRSKACNTCRRRKKGCDQGRPACGQCLKAKVKCAGYDRQRIFVNATGPGIANRNGQATVPAITTPNGRYPIATPTVTVSDSLTRVAYEVRYLESFWDTYLPLNKDLDRHMTYVNPSWAGAANALYPTDGALRAALLALGLATLGHRDGQPWMIHEGLSGYVRSLRHMSAQLRKPHGWRSDALLAASKALGLYELLHGANNRSKDNMNRAESWQSHNTGELALFLRRTPEMHTRGHSRLLFINSRMHLIIYSIVKRQHCPLSTPEWKTIPFRHIPKTYKDTLLDLLSDVPQILQDLDALRSLDPSSPPHDDKRSAIIQECWRLDRELIVWFDKYGPASQIQDLLERRLRNEIPSPPDIVTAHIMGIYWTACILVYSTLRSALAMNRGGDEILPLPARTEPRQYCRHVADIADVLLHTSAGVFGMSSLPLPVGVSLMCLNSMEEDVCSPEKRRLLDLFDEKQWRAKSIKDFVFGSMEIVDRL